MAIETCSVRVTRQTGYTLLRTADPEPPGFGLYSYLLFDSPPSAARRDAYLSAIGSILTMVPEMRGIQDRRPISELNILEIPVNATVRDVVAMRIDRISTTDAETKKAALLILEKYDYGFAGRLLSRLSAEPLTSGPYLCSTLRPLTVADGRPDHFLFQDLSLVPASVMPTYIQEFKRQTAKEQFWRPEKMVQYALRLRTALAAIADGVPTLMEALQSLSWRPSSK